MRILSWLRRNRRSNELLYDRGASGHFNHVHWAMNRTGRAERIIDPRDLGV